MRQNAAFSGFAKVAVPLITQGNIKTSRNRIRLFKLFWLRSISQRGRRSNEYRRCFTYPNIGAKFTGLRIHPLFYFQQVPRLTVQLGTNLCQRLEPHALNLAGLQQAQILFGDPDPPGQLARSHLAPCQHQVQPHDDPHVTYDSHYTPGISRSLSILLIALFF